MSNLNPNFYDLQSTRNYPLDDRATIVTDAGQFLHNNIIADCNLRFPESAGYVAFIGGITVTANIVTLTILAAANSDSTSGFVPIAAVTVPQPVNQSQHYAVAPLYPGVGGWVVFDDGVTENFVGRFSTPTQSLLSTRCARWYRQLPVTSLGKVNLATALTGIIQLVAGTDLEIVGEQIVINGEHVTAAIIRLVQSTNSQNVFQKYLGPCDARPESGTCPNPGIQSINGVIPDCNGNINLTITGAGITITPFADCSGLTIDSTLGLSQACTSPTIPEDAEDQCGSSDSVELPHWLQQDSDITPEFVGQLPELSSAVAPYYDLPYYCAFSKTAEHGFQTVQGQFNVRRGLYKAQAAGIRNVAIFEDGADYSSLQKQCAISCRLPTAGDTHNAGMVVNYRPVVLGGDRYEYFLILLDYDLQQARVLRMNGPHAAQEYHSPKPLPIKLDQWYKIAVKTEVITSRTSRLSVEITGLGTEIFPKTTFTLTTNKFLPADGKFGVGSDNSLADFRDFRLEEL